MAIAKKLYSINLVAFIYMVSKMEPTLGKDHMGNIYFLYPDTNDITLLINIYRRNRVSVDLKEYLTAYRHIRGLIRGERK